MELRRPANIKRFCRPSFKHMSNVFFYIPATVCLRVKHMMYLVYISKVPARTLLSVDM